MGNNFAIKNYLDADKVTKELDALIKKPIYSIKPEALKKYEREYYAKKCAKSKEMIDIAKQRIPGGVQHNLAFNYPFPLVFTKASGTNITIFSRQADRRLSAATLPRFVKRLLNCSMTAARQQVFSMSMSTSLQIKLPSVFRLLKCSVCSVRAQRLVCVRFVLQDLRQSTRISLKWAAHTTAGRISLPTE